MLDKKEKKAFFKTLIGLSIPIMLQEMLNSSVNMVDVLMIGSLGIEAVAAVGLANQIFFLFILLCFGIVSGSSIFTGQFYGKGDLAGVHKVMGICFVATTAGAAFFATGAIFFPQFLMRIYSNDETVIELGASYLRIIGFSYFFTAITASINAALRSIGQTKFPMITTMVALFMSVSLNYVFIFIFEMGVAGAALGTLSARIVEILLQIFIIFKFKLPVAAPFRSYFVADKDFIKTFFKTTAPVILNEVVWATGVSLYQIAYKYVGMEAQGAMQIASTVQNLFMVIGMAVGTSCGIMLANLLGAGEHQKAIQYSRKCLGLVVFFSMGMGIVLILCTPVIVTLFEISDEVKQSLTNIIYVVALGMPFKTFAYTTIVGILRSGGDTKFCLMLDSGTVWLIGVPCAFFSAIVLQWPIHFVFATVYIEEIVKCAISGHRVWKNKWARTLVN